MKTNATHPIASYPPRAVVFDYIKGRVEKAGVRKYIRFNCPVRHVSFDDNREQFTVSVHDLQADAVRDIGDGSMRSLEVTRGHYADGRFIYEGDRVQVDRISIEDLQQATQGLAHLMQPAEVIFYDQQSSTHYDPEALQTVVDALR